MLDRIDIIVEVNAVPFEDLRERAQAEPSSEIKQRVNAARKIQVARFGEDTGMCNARMGPEEMREFCALSDDCAALMKDAFETMGLTARSYDPLRTWTAAKTFRSPTLPRRSSIGQSGWATRGNPLRSHIFLAFHRRIRYNKAIFAVFPQGEPPGRETI